MRKFSQKPELDIILDILDTAIVYRPDSPFLQSLRMQYLERGSLSKKQLQGLHNKASKINEVATSKLATLEAKIIKMPDRFRSDLPEITKPLYEKDTASENLVEDILARYPQHKRVLFFKSKLANNEILQPAEVAELNKFAKLLLK
ncbi:hypothetical protein I5907_09015 [Panacibacter sp. DH6]|uniref:Uncharacterized protein n=1 Tax=Panacibacter microcysteis TaxID=2793269 RepID=A0A931E6I0_9BACT|nr:hypothetical protein [Panacibacter microcysteis]MBG9376371.1 hypothetical protein [Panacibacter microcysteis]